MVVFDVVETETSSLKLVTTTSVKLRNFPTAAESDRFLHSDTFTQSVSCFKVTDFTCTSFPLTLTVLIISS